MTHSRTRATLVLHRPCAREETTRRLRDHPLPPEGRAMDVRPTAAHSAINHDDPGRANLAQKDPSYNPTTRGHATHPSNACRSDVLTGKTSTCPTHATNTRRVEASLSSPWCRTRTKTRRLPPTSPGRGPRFLDPRNPPATKKGAAPHPDSSFELTLLSREPDPQGAGQRAPPNTRDPRPGRLPRECYRTILQTFTFQGEHPGIRAPRGPAHTSSGKVKRLGRRGAFGTYNLRKWYEGHTPRRKLTASTSGRGAARLPGIPIAGNPNRGTRGTTGLPHGATPVPCQRAQMCYAEPSPPRRTERPGATARAEPP